MAMELLGRLADMSVAFAPQDATGGITGKRVRVNNASNLTFVMMTGIGTTGHALTLTFTQYAASSGGASATFPYIDHYYSKSIITPGLTGVETWTVNSQTAATTIVLTGEDVKQGIYVVEIPVTKLTIPTYQYFGVAVSAGGATQLASGVWLTSDLAANRDPSKLAAMLS